MSAAGVLKISKLVGFTSPPRHRERRGEKRSSLEAFSCLGTDKVALSSLSNRWQGGDGGKQVELGRPPTSHLLLPALQEEGLGLRLWNAGAQLSHRLPRSENHLLSPGL